MKAFLLAILIIALLNPASTWAADQAAVPAQQSQPAAVAPEVAGAKLATKAEAGAASSGTLTAVAIGMGIAAIATLAGAINDSSSESKGSDGGGGGGVIPPPGGGIVIPPGGTTGTTR